LLCANADPAEKSSAIDSVVNFFITVDIFLNKRLFLKAGISPA